MEALPNKAWLTLVRKLCSMRPGVERLRLVRSGVEAPPGEVWCRGSARRDLVDVDVEGLLNETWCEGPA